ncbi:MAG TPA: uracil-DNA glycosylase [Candidatus Omnitrophota bacterium]|nr:uracil-DNA glycosylase [Candidatus Omnitrophota bacterium]HRK61561.1 uracil-DNA glycosylase [Candidatus Omnitrophota bacterium]
MTEQINLKKMKASERLIYLTALREGGVDALFLPSENKRAQPPVAVSDFSGQAPAVPAVIPRISDAEANPVRDAMIALRDQAHACTLCSELSSTRKKVVFGSGNIRARLVFVGEAPGADEDEQGLPFVGRAGQLLTKMIEAMGLTRKDVFICNVLKCRPPGNRPPQPAEKASCKPFLLRQLELIKPEVICALGTHAAQSLLQTEETISVLRGKTHTYAGVKLVCTFHPAYLLRNPSAKKEAWGDLQKVMALLDTSSGQRPTADSIAAPKS